MIKLFQKFSFLSTLALAGIFVTPSCEACTGIKLTAKDGSIIHGRTLEYAIEIQSSIAMIPRGYTFAGTTNNGPGLSYQSKYASLGAISFDKPAILDGINEKGLSVGVFYFPGFASYTQLSPENQSKALSPVDFSNWILTQFATVDEVKESLDQVVIVPTVLKQWGTEPPPFHYIVYDRAGDCLIIEPLNGKLVTYENKFGVITNSPTYDWHLTNMRNHVNLTTLNAKPIEAFGMKFSPLGLGSGMVGLPGDFTPPSRFVRAAIFTITATPPETAEKGIFQGFHILNQFDIPVGLSREKVGDVVYTDYTMVTCMRDPQALKFYFKTFDDQSIKMVDLKKFDWNGTDIKTVVVSGQGTVDDISSTLK